MKNIFLIILVAFSFKIYSQDFHRIFYDDMYFKAYTNFTEHESEYRKSNSDLAFLENMGVLNSFVGKYDKAIKYYTIIQKKRGFIPDSLRSIDLSGKGINQNYLNELYAKYNVVMFNESHHYSQHRAFLYSQLENLKSLGFTQLALETLNQNDTLLKIRKYPIKKTGFYTNDPVYGNVIRKALELGFILIPYDIYKKIGREKGEAKNIIKQYQPDKGKLFIYAGYGHISETGKWKMMGQYLHKMLKEDLLSISQFTDLSEKPEFPNNDNHTLFFKKDKSKQFDYNIYAKVKISKTNIPDWYSWMNFKTKLLKEIYNKSLNFPTLVQIFNINEKDAVPVYQYMIEKEGNVYIAYPKTGDYILKVIDKNGVHEYQIEL